MNLPAYSLVLGHPTKLVLVTLLQTLSCSEIGLTISNESRFLAYQSTSSFSSVAGNYHVQTTTEVDDKLTTFEKTNAPRNTTLASDVFISENTPVAENAEMLENGRTVEGSITPGNDSSENGSVSGLMLRYVSDTRGYIWTPKLNLPSGGVAYPPGMDSWVRVNTPEDSVVVITALDMDVADEDEDHWCRGGDKLELYAGGKSLEHIKHILCGDSHYDTILLAGIVHAHFVSDHVTTENAGFRLVFSLIRVSDFLQMLPSGRLNCSVEVWEDFREHFPCNFVQNCEGGEDEVDCPYTSEKCGLGFVTAGGKCFRVLVRDRLSFEEAVVECGRLGSVPAALKTREEWDDILTYLDSVAFNSLFDRIIIGLSGALSTFPDIYRNSWQWSDDTIYYYRHVDGFALQLEGLCVYLTRGGRDDIGNEHNLTFTRYSLRHSVCGEAQGSPRATTYVICQNDMSGDASVSATPEQTSPTIHLSIPTDRARHVTLVRCPASHMTHEFLACDESSDCLTERDVSSGTGFTCPLDPMTSVPPVFECDDEAESVPYTFVCDFRSDCGDESDENFCVLPPCDPVLEFDCGNKQCVPVDQYCDGVNHCLNQADELVCSPGVHGYISTSYRLKRNLPPPAILNIEGPGYFTTEPLENLTACPETHYQCPNNGYCMPVFTRCNGVYDCSGKEDELGCESYTCPGFYRCLSSRICVHVSHLCDGMSQCPRDDDELLCGITCPQNCTCYGLAFYCSSTFPFRLYLQLRYLDASGSSITPEDVTNNTKLVFLRLANCNVTTLGNFGLPNLRILDLSDNSLTSVAGIQKGTLSNLRVLILVRNPLSLVHDPKSVLEVFPSLTKLDLSENVIPIVDTAVFTWFPNLQILNMSQSDVRQVLGDGFGSLKHLQVLDMSACPVKEFARSIFQGLEELEVIYADNYKLCCPASLPRGFNVQNCHAPLDEISTCDALLRSDTYRVLLVLFSVFALFGNVGCFVFRTIFDKTARNTGFGVLVTHLCVSDFLMGVYLALIGVADRLYQETYLWMESLWRNSAACKAAGFLSLLSSEVSAFIICLITLDRFLVFRFPFANVNFRAWSAHLACGVAWAVGLVLAVMPLLPVTSHWQFYSQTGICIPLPITRESFAGHNYSFGVIIALNFVLFMLIVIGQAFIFWSVQRNSMSEVCSTKKSNDLTIARRLITIAMSDFLCWFPIGLLGVLASFGVPIPSEVNVAMAIVALPINSALNPFLYTLNVILERRRRANEARLKELFVKNLKTQARNDAAEGAEEELYTEEESVELLKIWLAEELLTVEQIRRRLQDGENRDACFSFTDEH